jgi:hypothetical protein|tara:strand:+ start:813 stop:2609 length:1797 start_codon:yes stop_codon:yes gene_type:complete
MADKKIRLLVKAEVNKAIKDLNKTEKSTNKLTLAAKQAMKAFAGLASAAALGAVVKSSVQTSAQFEALETRLVALKGSVDEGRKSFDFFNKVAATTPFQLANVVEAGAQLEAFGADSTETLKAVSDLAAFMGTDIVEAANAFGRAFAGGAGAADVLRERGVLTQVKLKSGFDDLSKLTLPQFRKALTDTLTDPEGNIAGATDLLSQTFTGLISNFQDSVSQLQDSIGDLLAPAIKDVVKFLKEGIDDLTDSFKQLNETAIETTLRKLKELGAEDENVLRTIADLERDVALQRQKAIGEQLEGLGSITEMSSMISDELNNQSKLQIKLGEVEREREELGAKGANRTREEHKRLNSELPKIIKNLESQIDVSDTQIEKLAEQIGLQKEYNQLQESIVGERPTISLLPDEDDMAEDLEVVDDFYQHMKDEEESFTEFQKEQAKTRKIIDDQLYKEKIQNNLQAAILQGQSAKDAALSVIKAEVAEAQAGLISSIMKSLPFPINLAVAAGAGGMIGRVTDQLFSSFATGGSIITKGRTTLPIGNGVIAGDNASGMERIDFTPLPSPSNNDRNITINISAPLVDETIVDTIIPAIRRAEKLGL